MKKVLALVLVAMMVLSIAPMSFAADVNARLGYSQTAIGTVANTQRTYTVVDAGGNNVELILVGAPGTYGTGAYPLDDTRVNRVDPRTDIRIYLFDSTTGLNVTKRNVQDQKLDVKTKVSSGSKAIDSISIQYDGDKAYIRIRFVNKYVATGDLDYKVAVYLTANKVRLADTEIELEGTLKNFSQEAWDYDYYYLFDRPVIEAKEYNKLVELELGEGVSIFAKLFEGKKYYGYATQKVKSEDDDTLAKYPAIGSIYYLDTIGLNSSGNYVKLDVDDKLFVYNADLEYIGTTADKLVYSTKYYVATEELDVDSGSADEPAAGDDEPAAATNPDMGGDDVPENVNDNPGTGC